jgi:2-phospho-L-lactate/phosphoenolpyruvate guanylyltransferase
VVLLVPVKALALAKSRLRGAHVDHDGLVLAIVHDTVSAAVAAKHVVHTVVVTDNARVIGLAEHSGVGVCSPSTGSLNADLRVADDAARRRFPQAAVASLPADLPALRTRDLEAAIEAAGGRRSFVPDHDGSGTTLLLSGQGLPLDPRYGRASGARHEESGACRLIGPWASLAYDVDTPADLASAATLGLGRRTGTFMREHENRRTTPQPMRASAGHDDARSA